MPQSPLRLQTIRGRRRDMTLLLANRRCNSATTGARMRTLLHLDDEMRMPTMTTGHRDAALRASTPPSKTTGTMPHAFIGAYLHVLACRAHAHDPSTTRGVMSLVVCELFIHLGAATMTTAMTLGGHTVNTACLGSLLDCRTDILLH